MERRRFADELLAVGPDAPTLCEGWTARDLAAHVVVRDSRPDAMPGVVVSAFAGYTERVQQGVAGREWEALVDQVRSGPPIWSPARLGPIDRLMNTTEFFVHLEDVRRAQPDWEPRDLDDDLVDDLHAALKRAARVLGRGAPAGIELAPDDGHDQVTARQAEPSVTVRGPVGELVLWMFGRQAHARVTYEGLDETIEAVRTASFGI